jgi:hypothetical protein
LTLGNNSPMIPRAIIDDWKDSLRYVISAS